MVIDICKYALSLTKSSKLCMAGGVALNCQTNLAITEKLKINDIYIPSAPNDAGVALGAAILESEKQGFKTDVLSHAYLGPKYSNAEISKILKDNNIRYKEFQSPNEMAANDILDGKIIGWFNGRMEFGPRALGARSILADPRNKKMKRLINEKIKFREEFRPFCPSILVKNTNQFYEEKFHSPFMNINKRAKKEQSFIIHQLFIMIIHREFNQLKKLKIKNITIY